MEQTRRDLLKTIAMGGAAAVALAAGGRLLAQEPEKPSAAPPKLAPPWTPGQHKNVALGFDVKKLEGLSAKLLTSHHDKNYAGALRKLNAVELLLAADKPPEGFKLGALKSKELAFTNSVIFHELYFGNLGGDGKTKAETLRAIQRDFGDMKRFELEFRNAGKSLGGGSGWTVLSLNFATNQLRVHNSAGHTQSLNFGRPLLVLDMYEHAYHMDYGPNAGGYIEAFMKNVDWGVVEKRLLGAQKALAALGA